MSGSTDERIHKTEPSAVREPPVPPTKIARGIGDQAPHEPGLTAPTHALRFTFYRPTRGGSTISGLCAWVFLVGVFLQGMSDPAWLHVLAISGLAFFGLASCLLHLWEKKHYPNATRLGLWLGCSALLVFILLALILPAL